MIGSLNGVWHASTRLMVTRPAGQADELAAAIADSGRKWIGNGDRQSLRRKLVGVVDTIDRLSRFDTILRSLRSTACGFLLDRIFTNVVSMSMFGGELRIAAVGEATAKQLRIFISLLTWCPNIRLHRGWSPN